MTLKELFQNIADTIRSSHYDRDSTINATDFPGKIQEACDNRESIGYDIGLDEGIKQGKQPEYDRFWDAYQLNRQSDDYGSAFAGYGWKNENFKPKYDIAGKNMNQIFVNSSIQGDLVEILAECGVEISFVNTVYPSLSYAFAATQFTKVGVLDFTKYTSLQSIFSNSIYLETIDEMIVAADTTFSNVFNNTKALTNLKISGTIGQDGFNVQWSPLLTTASLLSILTALSKDSSIANGKTVTFNSASKAVIEADTACSEQLALAVSAGWTIAYA